MADEQAPSRDPPSPVEAAGLTGRRILVVDDDSGVRAVLSRMLQSFGVEVETAPGGAQAMAKIDRQTYDALLLDLDMPGVTGLDVLLHVQRAAPRMPVLVVTGTWEAERIEGAVAVLAKPVDAPSLRTALAEAIRAAAEKK